MYSNTSDIALLRQWQHDRDPEAFHSIVQRYAPLVYGTCRKILKNEADAADVTQECFLSLANTPPKIERSLAGWLHRLATHRALNHLKSEQRRRNREIRYANELPQAVTGDIDDLLEKIDAAIDTLPDEFRVPVIDHFLRQKSHQEIADETGVSRRTVSYRINTGVGRMREHLKREGVAVSLVGVMAALERQRAEAVTLPAPLTERLGRHTIAGTGVHGERQLLAESVATAALLRKVLMLLLGIAALGGAWWYHGSTSTPTRTGQVQQSAPAITAEIEPQDTGNAAVLPAGPSESKWKRAAATEGMAGEAIGLGKVSGKVYDADTGAPIANAIVKIARTTDTHKPVATCTTDADGRYKSAPLPADSYIIYRGKTPGYGATSVRMDTRGTRLPRPEMDGIFFRLAGDTAIEFPVRRGLVVSGIVVDEFGNTLANATVSARTRFQNDGQTVKTAADGTFSLAGFSPTYDFCIAAHKSDYGRKNFPRLNLAYPGIENLRIELPVPARVSGRVIRGDGSPVAGAQVMAIHVPDIKRWPLEFPSATTDSHGRYRITDLGVGTHTIQLFSGTFNMRPERHARFVELTPGHHATDIDITLEKPHGFTISGIVTEPDGTPVSNRSIFLQGGLTVTIKTDAEGNFSSGGFTEGEYRLRRPVYGYGNLYENIANSAMSATSVPTLSKAKISVSGDRNDVHLVLEKDTFVLGGQVTEAGSGSPISYFEIRAVPTKDWLPRSTEDWHEARRIHSNDGTFRLENLGLTDGPCTVVVRAPGIGTGITQLVIPESADESQVSINIETGISVSGTVVDKNNVPVQGAIIVTGPPFEQRLGTSNGKGEFRINGLVPAYELASRTIESTLTAFHPAYPPITSQLPKDGKELRLQFGPTADLTVRVTRKGKPVTQALVHCINRPTIARTPCIGLGEKPTNDNGIVVLTGLAPGPSPISVRSYANSGTPISLMREVHLAAGETNVIDIEIAGTSASLRGTFFVHGVAAEHPDFRYEALTDSGIIAFSGQSAATEGTWRIDDVPAGPGTLAIDAVTVGIPTRLVALELAPGEVRSINLNHGGPGDAAELTAELRGSVVLSGVATRDYSIIYESIHGDTILQYRERPDETTGEWAFENIAAGSGVLTVISHDINGQYERSIEVSLTEGELKFMEVELTEVDMKSEH